MDATKVSEIVKNYAQVFAWLGAASFFAVKVIQGYFVIDLSITVASQRQQSSADGVDYLVVVIDLKKGDRGTFQIHDAQVVITQGDDVKMQPLSFDRFSFKASTKTLEVDLTRHSSKSPRLNFSPGESAHVSCFTEVKSGQPCLVRVVVLGTGFASPVVSQWQASTVSLPCLPVAKAVSV